MLTLILKIYKQLQVREIYTEAKKKITEKTGERARERKSAREKWQ